MNKQYLTPTTDSDLRNLEILWKKSCRKFTISNLVQWFPEGIHIVRDLLRGLKSRESEISLKMTKLNTSIEEQQLDDFSEYFHKEIVSQFIGDELRRVQKQIRYLKALRRAYLPFKKHTGRINDQMIQEARDTDIEEVASYHLELKRSGQNFVSLCPFHNEKTPSFYLFTKNNRFKCFGCGASGDPISLVMQLHNLDFVNSILFLTRHENVKKTSYAS